VTESLRNLGGGKILPRVSKSGAVRADGEDRDVVAPRVDPDQPPSIVAEDERTLTSQSAAVAQASRGDGAGRRERSVGVAVEDDHSVAGGIVRECVDGTDRFLCRGRNRAEDERG
jgi:hypothetical protein